MALIAPLGVGLIALSTGILSAGSREKRARKSFGAASFAMKAWAKGAKKGDVGQILKKSFGFRRMRLDSWLLFA
jgi:hypothetical protein